MSLNTTTRAHVCTDPAADPGQTAYTPAHYLASLPSWDGVQRLDTWLPHVLGVTPESVGMYRMEYLALAGRYWLLAMARRAMQPGCEFDQCLVLEGPAGTGKSTLLKTLAGAEFFREEPFFDQHFCHDDQLQIQAIWLYEVADLAAFNKADKQALKAFISSASDAYRAPYQAEVKTSPRQFVVAGTTNDAAWSRKNNSRQICPVPVPHAINTQWVGTHRDQLFAEAKVRIHEMHDMQDLSEHPGRPSTSRRRGAAC